MESSITFNIYYDNYSVEANNLNELNNELRWAKRKGIKIIRITAAYYVKNSDVLFGEETKVFEKDIWPCPTKARK